MLYRGTTPTHVFSFPFKQNEVAVLYISYFQKGSKKVEKELSDVTFDASLETIEVSLTQQETLSFEKYSWLDRARDSLILIQIRVRLQNGECWASEVMEERLGDVLKDGII